MSVTSCRTKNHTTKNHGSIEFTMECDHRFLEKWGAEWHCTRCKGHIVESEDEKYGENCFVVPGRIGPPRPLAPATESLILNQPIHHQSECLTMIPTQMRRRFTSPLRSTRTPSHSVCPNHNPGHKFDVNENRAQMGGDPDKAAAASHQRGVTGTLTPTRDLTLIPLQFLRQHAHLLPPLLCLPGTLHNLLGAREHLHHVVGVDR